MQDWGDKYSSDEDIWATEDEDYEGNESDSSSEDEYHRSRSVSDLVIHYNTLNKAY